MDQILDASKELDKEAYDLGYDRGFNGPTEANHPKPGWGNAQHGLWHAGATTGREMRCIRDNLKEKYREPFLFGYMYRFAVTLDRYGDNDEAKQYSYPEHSNRWYQQFRDNEGYNFGEVNDAWNHGTRIAEQEIRATIAEVYQVIWNEAGSVARAKNRVTRLTSDAPSE